MDAQLEPFEGSCSSSSASGSNKSSALRKVKHVFADKRRQLLVKQRHALVTFRWLAKLVATHSSYVLTSNDLVSDELQQELSEIGELHLCRVRSQDSSACQGQFSELAYCEAYPSKTSSLTVSTILEKTDILSQTDFPLEDYDALPGCEVVASFSGTVADLGAFVLHRPSKKQLVVGISGTKTLMQAVYVMNLAMRSHPSRRGKVHIGFWALYQGVKAPLVDALRKGLQDHKDVHEIVFTGHSMGGAVAYLLLLDIVADGTLLDGYTLPHLTIAAFGSPRAGNERLAQYWHEVSAAHRNEHGADSLREYAVKAHNDGEHIPEHLLSSACSY